MATMSAFEKVTKSIAPLVSSSLGLLATHEMFTFREFQRVVAEAYQEMEFKRRNEEFKRGIIRGDFDFRYHGEGILEGLSMDPDPRRQVVEVAIYKLNKRLFEDGNS